VTLNVVVFSKAPVPGEAKRRLIPALGAAGAAALSARLIRRVVGEAVASGVGPVQLCCAGDIDHRVFVSLSVEHKIPRHAQQGGDLGVRMRAALQGAVAAPGPAVVVGTDCPGLTARVFRQAAQLMECHDAVLGPAFDGGYVLLALREPHAMLFEGIPWSTEQVAALTRGAMQALGWRWAEIGPFYDIDWPTDLKHLPAGLLAEAGG